MACPWMVARPVKQQRPDVREVVADPASRSMTMSTRSNVHSSPTTLWRHA